MRESRAIMADLAGTGMTAEQIALVMELSAAVSAEARPVVDEAAQRRRERDREYQAKKRRHNRPISADSPDVADASPLSLSPNENNSNPHTHTPGDITPREEPKSHVEAWRAWRVKNPFPRPWWAEPQVWADWMQVRKRKGGVNTITAHNGFLSDIAKHTDAEWPPGRLLRLAVAKSWLSINRPHESPRNERTTPRSDEPQNPYVRAAMSGQARREAERAAAEFG